MRLVFAAVKALVYMTGFLFLWGWIALGFRRYDAQFAIILPPWTEIPGILLMIVGGSVALLCVGTFVIRGEGTPAPFDAPRKFVAVGPYRSVRNPMYIGGWILLMGFGLLEHSSSILLFSLAWLLLAHLFVLYFEEPRLEVRFGSGYLDYKESVSRWLPRWK